MLGQINRKVQTAFQLVGAQGALRSPTTVTVNSPKKLLVNSR